MCFDLYCAFTYSFPSHNELHRVIELHLIFCSFDHRAFRWMMTMVFAVDEINHNSSLLPGLKLGYRIMDSCDHIHTSLQAVFSLVSHSKHVIIDMGRGYRMRGVKMGAETGKTNILRTVKKRTTEVYGAMPHSLENNGNYRKENVTEEKVDSSTRAENSPSCLADSTVPAVIGLASSSPTRAVAQTLGPFNLPLVRKQ